MAIRIGGRFGALLLFAFLPLPFTPIHGQVSVQNGLAQFLTCDGPTQGEIILQNQLETPLTVLLEIDTLLGSKTLFRIPSEITLPPIGRISVPYTWIRPDSMPHGVCVFISCPPKQISTTAEGWAIHTQLRFAVKLYRGCLSEQPEDIIRVNAQFGSHTLSWQNVGDRFWKASVLPMAHVGEPSGPDISLFLVPHMPSVAMQLPQNTQFVLATDEWGRQLGFRFTEYAH
ncbi:MAG: hypothetical protein QNK62_00605 [Cryomorphaceae bacterium]|jgi:hypothetical protein|nr:MAG: hypothetical protein ABR87_05910 [Cryomorphaceae bacterium BACL7 MAG-121220-bin83]NQW25910.1 hypothetical protein [Cryomorphaceae bacterium]|tara:strand:- start:1437 stop:2123 length:687 start_codon:yes stop_codon:yes gene_type:complete